MEKIIRAEHAGFCFGVRQAIQKTEKQIEKQKEGRIFTCGQLIHNRFVTDDLEKKGVCSISGIEEAEAGDTVIVRSHGETRDFFLQADRRGVRIVDATCPFVAKIHKLVDEAGRAGGRR